MLARVIFLPFQLRHRYGNGGGQAVAKGATIRRLVTSSFGLIWSRAQASLIKESMNFIGQCAQVFYNLKINSSADLSTYHVCSVLSFLKAVIA